MDIQYLLFFQRINESSGGVLDKLGEVISEFGGSTVAIMLMILIYWCINKQLGSRILLSFSFGGVLTQTVKNTVCINRPWVLDNRVVPSQKALSGATGYSFPSGHSQTAVDLYGNITYETRKKKKVISVLSFIMMLLVPLSRNIIRVHTPQDVLTGMIVGAISLFIVVKLDKWLNEKSNRDLQVLGVGTVIVIVHLLYVSLKGYETVYSADGSILVDPIAMVNDCYVMCGLFFGTILGRVIEKRCIKFKVDGPVWLRVIRFVIGFALFIGLKTVIGKMTFIPMWGLSFIQMTVLVLFVICIWPLIFSVVEKRFLNI